MAADDILDELGSIVGIGVGSIDLMLIKNTFKAGDTVHGRVQLKLSRATEAKRLMIGVRGTRDRVTSVRDAYGNRRQQTATDTVYEFEQALDGARKNYLADAYDVHLPIPADAVTPLQTINPPDGALGDFVRVVGSLSSMLNVGPRPIVWHVFTYLDIPWKRNIKTVVQISVQPR